MLILFVLVTKIAYADIVPPWEKSDVIPIFINLILNSLIIFFMFKFSKQENYKFIKITSVLKILFNHRKIP